MSEAKIQSEQGAAPDRLAYFPVPLFAMVMGLSGLSIALHKGAHFASWLGPLSLAVFGLAALTFLLLFTFYALKAIKHPHALREDFEHPVRLHFTPTISISLILLSICALQVDRGLAEILLFIGAPLHLFLTLLVINRWLHREHFQPLHLTPGWFIPIVGNILVPIPGVRLGYVELSWLFFSVGIVFWPVLLTLIFNRFIFHPQPPERLRPTIAILIAPPAVGFLSYFSLANALDPFARVLFFFAAFSTLLLATQVFKLRRLPFFISWWAYSFPLAAMTAALFTMAEATGIDFYVYAGFGLLAIIAALIAGLFLRTCLAAMRGKICLPE